MSRTNRGRWRQIVLVLRAREALISLAINARERTLALTGVSPSSPSSYSVLDTHEAGEVAGISSTASHISLDVNPDDGNKDHEDINRRLVFERLARIVKEKDLGSLHEFGGVKEIALFLHTHLENGILGDEEDLHRRHAPCKHWNSPATVKGFFHFFLKACKNATIILLLLCAALSLGFGLKEEGPKNGWYDGVTILLAVFVLIIVPSVRNFYYARKLYNSLNKNKIAIEVVRDGQAQQISISDVVVGDIVYLKTGDQVPADGLLLNGYSLEVDEELDSIIDHYHNPFLLSGAKVIKGHGRMVVISLGSNTAWGEMMSFVTHDPNKTKPLQARLDKVNTYTQNMALLITILILVVLFMRFKLGKKDDETGYPELKGNITATREMMRAVERLVIKPRGKISILTTTLTVLLVGMQEGLPFVITLSLSYRCEKMMSDKVIIKELSACVTVGSVTTICTEITGGLTSNQVEVAMFWMDEEAIEECDSEIALGVVEALGALGVIEALGDGVGISALVPNTSTSPTGDLLLPWAEVTLGMNIEILKQSCNILGSKALNSDNKASGVLLRKNGDGRNIFHLHWKGDAATILAMCSRYYDKKGIVKVMDEENQKVFDNVIKEIGVKGLELISFAYKQIEVPILEEDGLILLGLVGVKNPCAEARITVEAYKKAGVDIKLVSGDDMSVVSAIAIGCGIHRPNSNSEMLEAKDFRDLSEDKRMEIVDRVSAMGNSLPSDKLLMAQCLKKKGHVVAVVGVGRNDCPALKEADVGISMGTHITEMAKHSSNIVVLDGSFSSLTTIFKSGRCAYDNIQKLIQLELTMIIAGLLTTSITTVSLGESPITALQLFWANLVVGTLSALTLLIEPQTHQNLKEKQPVSQTEPLITKPMWRNIITQVSFQVTILLTFQFKGQEIPGMNRKIQKAIIFNTFVLCQVFNQLNPRELEKNVFKRVCQNHFFLMAVGVTGALQVVMVEFANSLGGCVRLGWKEWAACLLTAMVSMGIDWSVKCISDLITNRSIRSFSSLNQFICTTPSAPEESHSHLELPLIGGESTPFPS